MTTRPSVPLAGEELQDAAVAGDLAPRDETLIAADGVRIAATYLPAPGSPERGSSERGASKNPVLVVGHGFTGSRAKDDNARVIAALNRRLAVLAFDYRGHGESEGSSTLGLREVLDLDAAITRARELGHSSVISLGFSMGATIAIRQAALTRTTDRGAAALTTTAPPDAVVAISGSAFWFYRGTAPMRLLHRAVSTPVGRAVLSRVSGTTVDVTDWESDVLPYSPEEAAAYVAPTPLLIVHGDIDHYFPLEHPQALHRGASEGARDRGLEPTVDLWIEQGLAHAEASVDDALLDRVCDWAVAAVDAR